MDQAILLSLLAVASTVRGFPATLTFSADDPRFTQYTPPGPDDVRSPCPGLNTLANHGFINHSGRDLTIPDLISGLSAGLNVGADFSTAIGGAGLLSSPNPLAKSFDLNDLDQHNFPIEHDGSLSRQDASTGNDYSFSQPAFNTVLSHYSGQSETSIPAAAAAKWERVDASAASDPDFVYGPREFVLSYGETALYLQTMAADPSQPFTGVASVDYVRSLFEQEMLPYGLGWRRPEQEITLATLGFMAGQLFAASPRPAPEAVLVGVDTLTDVWEAKDPITGLLANLTEPAAR